MNTAWLIQRRDAGMSLDAALAEWRAIGAWPGVETLMERYAVARPTAIHWCATRVGGLDTIKWQDGHWRIEPASLERFAAVAAWPDARALAERFGVSVACANRWCAGGLIEAVLLRRKWRVNPDALEGFTPPDKGRPRKGKEP